MNDLPPDLPRLRTLETYLALQLDHVRARITELEQSAAHTRPLPPPPDWLLEMEINGRHPLALHTGDCHMAGKRPRPLNRDQAMRALVEGVEPCGMCRPDTALGVID